MRPRPFATPPASAARAWEGRPLSPPPRAPRVDRDEARAPFSPEAFARARDALLRYDVYPPDVLARRVCTPDARMAMGALVVQRIPAPLFALEAGVRVSAFEDGPDRVGFAYATLAGHPERGVARFELAREGDELVFVLSSRSEPGALLTKLLRRYARRRQRAAALAGVARMRATLIGAAGM